MSMINWMLDRLHRVRSRPASTTDNSVEHSQIEALIRAHGDWIALLATILERERIITGRDLARSLTEFAELTTADRSAEGQILSFWALRLQETAAIIRDFPSVH